MAGYLTPRFRRIRSQSELQPRRGSGRRRGGRRVSSPSLRCSSFSLAVSEGPGSGAGCEWPARCLCWHCRCRGRGRWPGGGQNGAREARQRNAGEELPLAVPLERSLPGAPLVGLGVELGWVSCPGGRCKHLFWLDAM